MALPPGSFRSLERIVCSLTAKPVVFAAQVDERPGAPGCSNAVTFPGHRGGSHVPGRMRQWPKVTFVTQNSPGFMDSTVSFWEVVPGEQAGAILPRQIAPVASPIHYYGKPRQALIALRQLRI